MFNNGKVVNGIGVIPSVIATPPLRMFIEFWETRWMPSARIPGGGERMKNLMNIRDLIEEIRY